MTEPSPDSRTDPSAGASRISRQPITGPEAWLGSELVHDSRWHFELTPTDIEALDHALRHALSIHPDGRWQSLRDARDFPIGPELEAKLRDVAHELEHGSGLANLSRLPVERYDDDALSLMWMGLGRHLGVPRPQDYHGLLMRNIADEQRDTDAELGFRFFTQQGERFTSSKARTASNGPLRFHTDRTDVVGLLCIRQAAQGGISQIASSVTVHNTLLARRPDLVELLYQPYHRSRLGEEKGGENLTYALPVFGLRDGRFTSHYSRTYVEAAQEMDDVPRLGPQHWEALDALAEVAQEVCLETRMQPGEIQLINNHVIYHARTAFEDAPEASPGSGRCLRRLWLSVPDSRALPDDHAVLWRDVSAGALRGGIAPAPP